MFTEESQPMEPRVSAFWARIRAHRLASTLSILATLALGILIGTVISFGVKGQEKNTKSSDATPLTVPSPQQLSNQFSQVAKQLEPSVVNINTESVIKTSPHTRRRGGQQQQPDDDQNPFEDFFDRFFGGQGGQGGNGGSVREKSLGSGVIVDPKGYILTNRHVVEKADRIRVKLQDDPPSVSHDAKVIGSDQETDLAVIKIDVSKPLPAAKLGNSDSMQVGDWVIAIGSPFGLQETVTAGIVSAIGRSIVPNRQFQSFIQTDAAINPGNSGGPLTNALGEVVGINSSIFSNSGGSVGLGFAIPIERALRVADEIIRNGAVRRAWVGLEVGGAAAMRNWKSQGGVEVAGVTPDGPADRAGLRTGDVLVQANGRRLRNYLDWEAVKLDLHVGDAVELTVRTGSSSKQRRIVTGDLPTVTAEKVTVLQDLQLITVTPSVQAERGIRSQRGALIFKISPQVSRATGLQTGDVIVAINRTAVRNGSQVGELLNARSGEPIRVYFERDGQITFTDLAFR
jgi:serine protease Do